MTLPFTREIYSRPKKEIKPILNVTFLVPTVTSSRAYLNQYKTADRVSLDWTANVNSPSFVPLDSAGLSIRSFRGTALTYIKAYVDAFTCGPFLRDPAFHGSPWTGP